MALTSGVTSLGVLDMLIESGGHCCGDPSSNPMTDSNFDWATVGCDEKLLPGPPVSPDLLGGSNFTADDILDDLVRGLDDLEREQQGLAQFDDLGLQFLSSNQNMVDPPGTSGEMDEATVLIRPPDAAYEVEVSQEHSYCSNGFSISTPQLTNFYYPTYPATTSGGSYMAACSDHHLGYPSAPTTNYGANCGLGSCAEQANTNSSLMWGSSAPLPAPPPSPNSDSGFSASCSSLASSNTTNNMCWPPQPPVNNQSPPSASGSDSGVESQSLIGGEASMDLDQYLSNVSFVIDQSIDPVLISDQQNQPALLQNSQHVVPVTAGQRGKKQSTAVVMDGDFVADQKESNSASPVYSHGKTPSCHITRPVDRGRTGMVPVGKSGKSAGGRMTPSPTSGTTKNSLPILPFHSKDIAALDKYPALSLSGEELEICKREDIHLPSHYPLTKMEERDLKKVRRKIRNKLSAEESRRKKKIYMEALEDRVTKAATENRGLKKEVENLKQENSTLMSELKRLQALVGGKHKKTAQTGTCLAVMLLSFALLVAPNYSPLGRERLGKKAAQQALKRDMTTGHSRTLLSVNSPALMNDDMVVEDLITDHGDIPSAESFSQEEMLLSREELEAASMKMPSSITSQLNQPINDEYINEMKIKQEVGISKLQPLLDSRVDRSVIGVEKLLEEALDVGWGDFEGGRVMQDKDGVIRGNLSGNEDVLLGKQSGDGVSLIANQTFDGKVIIDSPGVFKRGRLEIKKKNMDIVEPDADYNRLFKKVRKDLSIGVSASVTIPAVYMVKSEEL